MSYVSNELLSVSKGEINRNNLSKSHDYMTIAGIQITI